MISKRDLDVVRLACRRGWLTPQQGEDCIVRKRRLGDKLTIEEIVRRQGHLDREAFDALLEATERLTQRSSRRPRGSGAVRSVRRAPQRSVSLMRLAAHALPTEELTGLPDAPRGAAVPGARDPTPAHLPRVERPGSAVPSLPREPYLPQANALSETTPVQIEAISSTDALVHSLVDDLVLDAPSSLTGSNARTLGSVEAGLPPGVPTENADGSPDPGQVSLDTDEVTYGSNEASLDTNEVVFSADDAVLDSKEITHDLKAYRPVSGVGEPSESNADADRSTQDEARNVVPASLRRDKSNPKVFDIFDYGLVGDFGPYRFERIIGHGKASVVYLATEPGRAEPIAVKVLSGDAQANRTWVAKQGDALLGAARLSSSYVVRLLDVGRVEDRWYIALERVEGWTLAEQRVVGANISVVETLEAGRDVARALAHAHAQGVVHGDLRAERVWVTPHGARLAGFGWSDVKGKSPLDDIQALKKLILEGLEAAEPPEDPELMTSLLEPSGLDAAAWVERLSQRLEMFTEPVKAPVTTQGAWAVGAGGALFAALVMAGIGWTYKGQFVLPMAMVAAIGLLFSLGIWSLLGLIRRGRWPLPRSTAWMVRLRDMAGATGAGALVFGWATGALFHEIVGGIAFLVAVSWGIGIALRRRLGQGKVRMLALLEHPIVAGWRAWHTPLFGVVTVLASLRWALLAYFAAH